MNRRALILGSFAAVAVAAGTALWAMSSPINKANFERIEPGMTLQDVEALLRGPARDESSGELLSYPSDEDKAERGMEALWYNEWGSIAVHFDSQDKVVFKEWIHGRRQPPWNELLQWLGLQERPRRRVDGAV